MLKDVDIDKNKSLLLKFSDKIVEKSNFNFILSDPTRIKILFLLQGHKELCVTDLSKILDISMGAVSHQLSFLEKSDCVKSVKMGQMVCYLINKSNNKIIKSLDLEIK